MESLQSLPVPSILDQYIRFTWWHSDSYQQKVTESRIGKTTTQEQQEREETMINREDYHLPPKEGFVLTHFLTVADVKRSAEFYLRILGGTIVRSGEPTIIQLANSWLILNVGGGPTDDKPNVTLRPPVNPNEVSSFLNIRLPDITTSYTALRSQPAEFLTEPKDHGVEVRCYMRDPDNYLIEVGQTTAPQA